MRGRRAVAAVVASLALWSLAVVPAAVPASAAPFQEPCDPQPRGVPMRTEPWGQRRLDFKRAWAYTKGEGVLVGVVDSGVDATHPQLRGHVLPTIDLTHTRPLDCNGHGTRVAGIIVGQDLGRQGIVFVGVAPGARVLPVKQTDAGSNDDGAGLLAEGIRTAVDRGAKVINVSITTPGNVPALEAAVKYAQAHDVVIVAAAGNESNSNQNRPQYPANYPGVVGVAAIDQKGERAGFSVTATHVTVAAPGAQIISTAAGPQNGYNIDDGTSFAAPFVAGVAALVRSYHPELNYKQVIHRIEVTADHSTDPTLGFGVVNPYEAVTAVLPEERTATQTARPRIQAIPPLPKVPSPDTHTRNLALLLAGIGVVGTMLLLAGAVVVPRGRRRRWQPGQRVAVGEPEQPQALLT
jgi:membrane-anchored mycosin MYCP